MKATIIEEPDWLIRLKTPTLKWWELGFIIRNADNSSTKFIVRTSSGSSWLHIGNYLTNVVMKL